MPKLDEFSLFDNSFPDLANFWDLNDFLPFKFSDFLAISLLLLISNPSILLSPTSSYLRIDFSNSIVIFSIKVSRTAILLKL